MASAAQQIRSKAELIACFVQRLYAVHPASARSARPMLVSMQGPQGAGEPREFQGLMAGKSSLAAALVDVLGEGELKCAVASMDDFYLPHAGLTALAAAHPTNTMLAGRGPPGTHDLELLGSVLSALRRASPSETAPVELPVFDKSAHDGEGDRAGTISLTSPLDVFVLEGWSLGFAPLPQAEARSRWTASAVARQHEFASIQTINANLGQVAECTDAAFDAHVTIRPLDYAYVYDWRTEQEHKMKAKNGGKGLSDEAVRRFVDRYMPVYELFGDSTRAGPTLCLTFDENRNVVRSEET